MGREQISSVNDVQFTIISIFLFAETRLISTLSEARGVVPMQLSQGQN